METIFGSSMGTGRFALGSSEPLGVNNVDSVAAKIKGQGFTTGADVKCSPKMASAFRETRPSHVDPDLYLAVMEMPGFTTEAFIVAYTYLLKNKVLGKGFVNMAINHWDIWLRNYLAKNNYI
ncbi:unnamed protein product [Miscanthus lutarioriparius]|uniref:Uncharacterized protein n=1 Tax=Miscanthus lutarioriparius TaxID=422564 RepID=A0A811R475_9POAL|nr:unnamed protein product [Miscanthus lutarioriparius]